MPQTRGSALDDTNEPPQGEVNYVKFWLTNVVEKNFDNATIQVNEQVKPDPRALERPDTDFLKLYPGPV